MSQATPENLTIAIDVMGSDKGARALLKGVDSLARAYPDIRFLICGLAEEVAPIMEDLPRLKAVSRQVDCETVIEMDEKPSVALRRGRRSSSMWYAIDAVKRGAAHAAVSAGNTGALMAMSKIVLRTLPGIERPAIAALWPTVSGRAIVLDVGATIHCTAEQFVQLAVMGRACARAILKTDEPRVGLLNIGVEEVKGTDNVREAAEFLTRTDLNFVGFVEGDGIALGASDVIVTDGFTGNVALKTAEGTAKQVGQFLREAMRSSLMARIGGVIALGAFRRLRARMDPDSANGGVFLGLNGIVVKSHGGADSKGFAAALRVAIDVARADIGKAIADDVTEMKPLLDEAWATNADT